LVNYGEMRLGQGAENAKKYLRDNPAIAEELTRKILEKRGLLNPAPTPAPASTPEPKEEAPMPAPTNNRRRPAAAAAE